MNEQVMATMEHAGFEIGRKLDGPLVRQMRMDALYKRYCQVFSDAFKDKIRPGPIPGTMEISTKIQSRLFGVDLKSIRAWSQGLPRQKKTRSR